MSTSQEVLRFYREPQQFSTSVTPQVREAWVRALNEVAIPQIEASSGRQLRPAQVRAWQNIADARAALVLGPPGTGKTFVLSWMAAAYLQARRAMNLPARILITGFTLNSIGNLLDETVRRFEGHLCSQQIPPVYFMGSNEPTSEMNPRIERLSMERSELADNWALLSAEHLVIGCSVWSLFKLIEANCRDLTTPIFDLVCIDEASQMVVSHGLLALAGLKEDGRVLVAGDNRQLAPVRETMEFTIGERRIGGSLYDFLKSAHVLECPLEETFRMNQPLTYFPENWFYPGIFRAAEEVAENRLVLRKNWDNGLEPWEQILLDPENPVCVVLYEGPFEGTSNPFEQKLAIHLTRLLRDRMEVANEQDFWSKSLAIISPHRAQNAGIRAALRKQPFGIDCVVETVDRIQGKERDAIIFSYTVSDPEFAVAEGEFLFAPQRLNVAITRAKTKLIVFINRKLLDVVPQDPEILDSAQVLRDFVFSTAEAGQADFTDDQQQRRRLVIRVRRFESAAPLPEMPPAEPRTEHVLTPELQELFDAIITLSAQNARYPSVTDKALDRHVRATLHRKGLLDRDIAELLRLGLVQVRERDGRYGPFRTIAPWPDGRAVYSTSDTVIDTRIEQLVGDLGSSQRPAKYLDVRDYFAWMDDNGNDVLRPIVDRLIATERIVAGTAPDGSLTLAPAAQESGTEVQEQAEPLCDSDFEILNFLEDLETRRVTLGIFESWVSAHELSTKLKRSNVEVADTLRRLEAQGYVMLGGADRVRSRIAELAREVRYVKQRFAPGDSGRRPYVVRSLKLRIKPREKPLRDYSLQRGMQTVREQCSDADTHRLLDIMFATLAEEWKQADPLVARFQAEAFSHIACAWVKNESTSLVLTADTGSGKTEAAVLPLLIGAARDLGTGVQGTRALLTYPRIRLSINQAERLCRYLHVLHEHGFPAVTVGVQNAQTPDELPDRYQGDLWARVPGESTFRFPLFGCPRCHSPLLIDPQPGNTPDKLICRSCQWRFDGWIGTKRKIRSSPPSILLIVTESLHQWMHNPKYARVFGDIPGTHAPRALLADEIHLYTNIHGAQVGYAFRRLLHRARLNSGGADPLSIGMSATLSDAARIWGELSGRSNVLEISPTASDRAPSIRGREYFFFVQPEVESRGKDVAGASATIQSLMCLTHGMRRRTGSDGGFRSIVFLDSVDKLKRLHSDYEDAERRKLLARLRTNTFGTDPITGAERTSCCAQPATCDAFRNGECWYFACNDGYQRTAHGLYRPGRPLNVAWRPVYSGESQSVERMIAESDVVFATSTLEVGYDDPDMALVYQHYAPRNLASFIQRKGRGGRAVDDRPITGVTLSAFSPRDAWYFRRPETMLDASSFRAPINMANVFVVRGQVLAALLDVASRHSARSGENIAIQQDGLTTFKREIINDASKFITGLFGADVFARLGTTDLESLWRDVQKQTGIRLDPRAELSQWREQLPYIPSALFDTINLPVVRIEYEEEDAIGNITWMSREREDVTLALASCAPGNMTRRYGIRRLHWIVPQNGNQPWLSTYKDAQSFTVPGLEEEGGKKFKDQLPLEVRSSLGELYPKICRPVSVRLASAGNSYQIDWLYDATANRIEPLLGNENKGFAKLTNKTRSALRGFVLLQADQQRCTRRAISALAPAVAELQVFAGTGAQVQAAGLLATRVFWAADVDVRTVPPTPGGIMTQFFVHPRETAKNLLHGYRIRTEGVRLILKSELLTEFADAEGQRLQGSQEGNWLKSRLLMYLLLSGGSSRRFNLWDMQLIAELLATATSQPGLASEFAQLLRRWDSADFLQLLLRTYRECLSAHPLLSIRRIGKLSDTIEQSDFFELLKTSTHSADESKTFRDYLRSLVLHGLALRLRESFVLHGFGDKERVLFHAKLPMQFASESTDVISVFENGEYGDGTTRAFVENLQAAFGKWREEVGSCPVAAEDDVLEAARALAEREPQWRSIDSRNADDVLRLKERLGIKDEAGNALQAAMRLLFGNEEMFGERFEYFELHNEIRAVGRKLMADVHRDISIWELASAGIVEAKDGGSAPLLRRLRELYSNSDELTFEGTLTPEARVAEQVVRLSASLCVDGCSACLPPDSDIMGTALAEVCLSRRVLARFAKLFAG